MGCKTITYYLDFEVLKSDSTKKLTSKKSVLKVRNYQEARFYNRELGRYMSTDPWQAKYLSWSTYNYTMVNPINLIDPTGKGPTTDFVNINTGEHIYVDDGIDQIALVENQNWAWVQMYENAISTGYDLSYSFVENKSNAETYEGGVIIQSRIEEGSDYTISEFKTVGGDKNVTGYMLEPGGPSTTTPNQDKRIPEGVYDIDNYSSAKYPDNFILSNKDVSKSRKILYHAGNNGDNTEGCNMPGTGKGNGVVTKSRDKMEELRTFIKSKGATNVKTIINNKIPEKK